MTDRLRPGIILVLVILLACSATPAFAKASLKDYFGKSADRTFFCDKTERSGGVVRATVRMVPVTAAFKQGVIKERAAAGAPTKGYEGYAYTLQVWELDCAAKTTRTVSSADYATGNVLLEKNDWPGAKAEAIPPGSMAETLLKEVCGQGDKTL